MSIASERDAPVGSLALRYWQAVADLPVDRRRALAEIEACFVAGDPAQGLDGRHEGRVLATTFGSLLDVPFRWISNVWMPWKGKVLSAERSEGRNLFASSFTLPKRVVWPGYRDEEAAGSGMFTTYRFTTWSGPSSFTPGVTTFKIDYDLPESPRFLIRSILDEVVQIGEGVFLGQALLKWRGAFHRAAWFQLRSPADLPR
jgi:hypothetical protein